MKKKKFLSQIKYEKENPLISFRIKRHEREKIRQMAQKNGKSISELVRIALLDLEKDFSTTIEDAQKTGKEEGTNIGYKNGYTEGYNNGKNEWAISIPCWKCKQLVHIKPNSKERTRVIELLKDKVHHPECCSLYYDNIPS